MKVKRTTWARSLPGENSWRKAIRSEFVENVIKSDQRNRMLSRTQNRLYGHLFYRSEASQQSQLTLVSLRLGSGECCSFTIKCPKRNERQFFQKLGDWGKDRYWSIVFGQHNMTFWCKGMIQAAFHLSGKIHNRQWTDLGKEWKIWWLWKDHLRRKRSGTKE